ncbi:hypothetical protein [Streptomyces sp. SYSU K21746]
MTSPSLTIETPAGTVRATAGPRQADAVVFELSGAMRGSVHLTGTHHPHHWDQFTAVRACLGPVNPFQATAPDDALPRLARSRAGYRGSLTLYRDYTDRPQVTVYPMESAAGHDCCEWVAEYPGNRPGSGGGIPGFTSRMWASRFLYRYRKPQPSGRP